MIEETNYYKVGIDLSTRKTGVVILDEHNNLKFKGILELLEWQDCNIIGNLIKIDNFVKDLNLRGQKIKIGIELSNFKNPQITQRFSFYAGAFTESFLKWFPEELKELKLFNANAWQFLIGCKANDERQTRKEQARGFALHPIKNCGGR